jgi:hypothetical protein
MTRTSTPAKQPAPAGARQDSGQTARTGRQTAADLAFLARAMKAPALLDAATRLAERARAESWTHTEYLVACRILDPHRVPGRLPATGGLRP